MKHARLLRGADWDKSVDGGFSTIDKRYGSFLYSLKTAQTVIEVSHKNEIYRIWPLLTREGATVYRADGHRSLEPEPERRSIPVTYAEKAFMGHGTPIDHVIQTQERLY